MDSKRWWHNLTFEVLESVQEVKEKLSYVTQQEMQGDN